MGQSGGEEEFLWRRLEVINGHLLPPFLSVLPDLMAVTGQASDAQAGGAKRQVKKPKASKAGGVKAEYLQSQKSSRD